MTLVNTAQRLLTTGSTSVFVEIREMIGLRFLLQCHDDILADAVDNFLIEFWARPRLFTQLSTEACSSFLAAVNTTQTWGV